MASWLSDPLVGWVPDLVQEQGGLLSGSLGLWVCSWPLSTVWMKDRDQG